MTRRRRVAPVVSTICLAWCVFVGFLIWFAPVHGASTSGGVTAVTTRRFSDVTGYGALPLVIPVLIAGLGTWAAWRGRRIVLGGSVFLLAVFTVITGFSIGLAYVPATGLQLVAVALAAWLGSGRLRPEAA